MHPHRLALALPALLFACQTGIDATGSTSDTGDDMDGSTTAGEQLPCGEAPSSREIDGRCWCEEGTTWVEPFNPNSFDCAPIEPRDGPCDEEHGAGSGDDCTCVDYYAWCSVANANDASCCYDPSQDPDGSHAPPSETTSGDASTSGTDTVDTSTGDTDPTSTDSSTGADASTGAESSTGDTSSSGDAGTDSSSSSSGAAE